MEQENPPLPIDCDLVRELKRNGMEHEAKELILAHQNNMFKNKFQELKEFNAQYARKYRMKKGEEWNKRNKIKSNINMMYNRENLININVHNSKEHEQLKFEICYYLKCCQKHFITEAEFKYNYSGRADIVNLDDEIIYEILISETDDMFKEKIKKYPHLRIVPIRSLKDYYEEVKNGRELRESGRSVQEE